VSRPHEPLVRKAYYAMGEVCELTGLKPHVLRYWESQFDELRPVKNAAGNRVYRPHEVEFILLLRRLLHEEKLTLQGARQRLRELRTDGGLEAERRMVATPDLLRGLRDDLLSLREILARPFPSRPSPAPSPEGEPSPEVEPSPYGPASSPDLFSQLE